MGRELKRRLRVVRDIALGVGYLGVVYVFLVLVAVSPAYALKVAPDQYSRVIQQAEMIAFKAAQRATVADAVAAAALVVPPVSLAVKVVAAGLTLGVPLGLAIWETYMTPQKLAAVKVAAAPIESYSVAGVALPVLASAGCPFSGAAGGMGFTCSNPPSDQWIFVENCANFSSSGWGLLTSTSVGDFCPGTSTFRRNQIWVHASGGSNPLVVNAGTPTQAAVKGYVEALPASDPNSIESNTTNKGQGVATATADTTVVATQPLVEGDTVVKKTTDVAPTDTVVAQNQPAPANTTTSTTTTNTTNNVTTTTTVANPDGSTTATSTETEGAVSSCTAGGHEVRTFATVLQAHQQVWQASGLLASLTVLSNLVFPGTVPTLTFTSSLFGSFQVDLTQWGWVFTALQTIFIAFAGMVAIRLVFVGG